MKYSYINQIPSIKVMQLQDVIEGKYFLIIGIDNINYHIEKNNNSNFIRITSHIDYFDFKIISKQSNLTGTKYYELECSLTGKNMRKLYFAGGACFSRHSIKGLYYKQKLSKLDRLCTYCNELREVEPEYYNQKNFYYNGKPTKTALKTANKMKRLAKYEEKRNEYMMKILAR